MSAESYTGADSLPADPWSDAQFDLVVTDDVWMDRFHARLDRAVEHAVGTSNLGTIETARGVVAALRRRRNGEDADFGDVEDSSTVTFRNELGNPIRAGIARSKKDPRLIRLWMESPTSRVENIMTNAEGLGLHTLLQSLFKVGPAQTAADLDADLPPQVDVRDWVASIQDKGSAD